MTKKQISKNSIETTIGGNQPPGMHLSRRNALKILIATTGASTLSTLPNKWITPTVEVGALPVFAQISPISIPVAPVLSNISYQLFNLNDPFLCINGGSAYLITFEYKDPNGDFDENTVVRTTATFIPTGQVEIVNLFPIINGDRFNGLMTIGVCILFATNTSVDVTVAITDSANLTSNTQKINISKPLGANDTQTNGSAFNPIRPEKLTSP